MLPTTSQNTSPEEIVQQRISNRSFRSTFYPRSVPFRSSFVSARTRASALQCNQADVQHTHEKQPSPLHLCTHARTHGIKMKMLPRGTLTRDFEWLLRRAGLASRGFIIYVEHRPTPFPVALYTGISCLLAVSACNRRARNNYSGCIGRPATR